MPKLRNSSYMQVFTVPTLMATKKINTEIEQHNTNYKTFFVAYKQFINCFENS